MFWPGYFVNFTACPLNGSAGSLTAATIQAKELGELLGSVFSFPKLLIKAIREFQTVGICHVFIINWQPSASHEQVAKTSGPDAANACANYFTLGSYEAIPRLFPTPHTLRRDQGECKSWRLKLGGPRLSHAATWVLMFGSRLASAFGGSSDDMLGVVIVAPYSLRIERW